MVKITCLFDNGDSKQEAAAGQTKEICANANRPGSILAPHDVEHNGQRTGCIVTGIDLLCRLICVSVITTAVALL